MKINNKFIGNLLAGALLLSMPSCDFLDTTPQDFTAPETFYKNEADCNMALAGIYWTLATEKVYGDTYSNKISNTDDLSFYTRANQADNPPCNTHGTGCRWVWDAWVELYNGINNANVLLANIDNASISNDQVRNRIKGEAKFLRAYYHFLLAQGWSDVPVRKEVVKDITASSLAATPHNEAIDWVISEMEEAIDMVDNSIYDLTPSHVKKTVVEGILARVCLWRAGFAENDGEAKKYYTKARDYAKAVIDSGKHKLSNTDDDEENIYLLWKNLAQDKYDKKYNESMWEVEAIGNRLDGRWSESRIGNTIGNQQLNAQASGQGYSYAFYGGTLILWDLYEEEAGDLRRDLSMAPYVLGKKDEVKPHGPKKIIGRFCGKYRREWETLTPKDKNHTPCNYCILRYADVLLMYAEAENEINNGPTDAAYKAINEVRHRAKVSNYANMNYDTFKQNLQNERGRELCFESIRKYDLIRWGIYYDRIHNVLGNLVENDKRWGKGTLQIAPSQYVKSTTERHIFLPIPMTELAVNKLLEQNKYWK